MKNKLTQNHLLLLVGIGGHTVQDALISLTTITQQISIIFIKAWGSHDYIYSVWKKHKLSGELLIVESSDDAIKVSEELNVRKKIHGVVTYSELLLRVHALIINRLGLPGSPVSSIEIAQSKARQRQIFLKHGVCTPRFAVINELNHIKNAISHVGLPAVFKPSLGAGSVGVHRVDTVEQVYELFKKFILKPTIFLHQDTEVVLEELIPLKGDENSMYANYVSVESLLMNGKIVHLAVTDRPRIRHDYIEEGAIMPSHLCLSDQKRLMEEAGRAIRAIGLTHGAVHTEISWINKEPKIIEVNARAGGAIPSLFESATNYDYARDIALSYLNINCEPTIQYKKAVWQRFIPIPDGEWKLVEQTSTNEVMLKIPNLVYLSPRFQVGQKINRQFTLHLASFMVTANTINEAKALADNVEKILAIKLKPL